MTALDWAEERGKAEVASLLRVHSGNVFISLLNYCYYTVCSTVLLVNIIPS